MLRVFSILLCIFCSTFIGAQIILNEYSASNLRTYPDNYGEFEDWIELYNTSSNDVNIGNWYLSDKVSKPKKWQIPVGTVIKAQGYLVFWASGRDRNDADGFHTNFKLGQSDGDDFVVLTNAGGSVVEFTPLMVTPLNHSVVKSVNNTSLWLATNKPSPGAKNEGPAYTKYANKPIIVTKSGFYKDSVSVVIASEAGCILKYTLDGSTPTLNDASYNGSIVVKNSSVLHVRCFPIDTNVLPSLVEFATFFIDEPSTTLPIVSIGGGPEAIELAEGNRELKPVASIELFDKNGRQTSTSYGELDSHGQDSWINDQRSLDWISRDEMGISKGLNQKIFAYSDRDSYQRIILRASGDDNYPAVDDEEHEGSTHVRDEYVHTLVQKGQMKMDIRALERCIVYINGRYWGVYTMREKPDDHDYISHIYDQDKYEIQFLKTWGSSWAEYGGDQAKFDWVKLRDEILNSDVSQDAVYQKITDQLDVISLMDYMIANLSAVSSDWLNYNTGWYRGLNPAGKRKKWGYVMWDNDATFDYYINYSGVPDISVNAKACDLEEISNFMDGFFPSDTTLIEVPLDSFLVDGEWQYIGPDTFYIYPDLGKHEKIFFKLLDENENFRNTYFARYADMINTTFSCENMLSTLDSLVNIIKPEMPRHIGRWSGTMTEWNRNIKRLRDFVSKRCNKIGLGLQDCYNLSGPYEVTVMSNPPNAGMAQWNTLSQASLPWNGSYYGNMYNQLEVVPKTGNTFLYWESKNNKTKFLTSKNNPSVNLELTARDTIIAVFENAVSTQETSVETWNVTPNPVSNMLTVQTSSLIEGNQLCTISNSLGQVVFRQLVGFQDQKTIIDVSQLEAGSYILSSQNQSKSFIAKFIVIK